jgi:hypothetical protein
MRHFAFWRGPERSPRCDQTKSASARSWLAGASLLIGLAGLGLIRRRKATKSAPVTREGARPACRDGRANRLATDGISRLDPQPAVAEASDHHRPQIELRPADAARAIGVEPVPVLDKQSSAVELHLLSILAPRHRATWRTADSAQPVLGLLLQVWPHALRW